MSFLRSLAKRAFLLLVISCTVGFAVNSLRSDSLPLIHKPLKDSRSFVTKDTQSNQALFITLSDAREAYTKGNVVMLDARPVEDFNHLHIKNAISLYYEEAPFKWNEHLKSVSKDKHIITYCSDPECESAIRLADTLTKVGFHHVSILLDGLPAWSDAGYPVQSNE